ncbi:MAG TPA: 50S ribosomal protein L31 [bacterium]
MRPDIHPNMQPTEFTCACGNKFTAISVIGGARHVEICSACHPYFTGKEKLIDSAGRIEKFNRRYKRGDHQEPAKA